MAVLVAVLLGCVAQDASPAFEVSAGFDHVVALGSDGRVVTWGADNYGQLGRGQLLFNPTPLKVNGVSNVVSVSESHGLVLALTGNGRLYTWGQYWSGEPRDASSSGRAVPELVPGIDGVVAMSASDGFAVALRNDGTVLTWGENFHGQLGLGYQGGAVAVPTRVPALGGIVAVAAGQEHMLAIAQDGTVWAWGYNGDGSNGISGALGDGSTAVRSPVPVKAVGIDGAVAVCAGVRFSIALKRDGTVWAWGYSRNGETGIVATSRPLPAPIPELGSVRQVACGFNHALALRSDGSVWSWGTNSAGELGAVGLSRPPVPPAPVAGVPFATAVAAGNRHSLVLDSAGRLLAFGENGAGQLGDGTVANSSAPVAVSSLSRVSAIAAGSRASHAVLPDGTVQSWGSNRLSQLGVAYLANSSVPTPVAGDDRFIAVAAGFLYTLGVKPDGTVWGWGRNSSGQLADGTLADRSSPVRVSGISDVVSVAASAGNPYSVAVRRDGTVAHWGPFTWTYSPTRTPVRVDGAVDVASVAVGSVHALALSRTGVVWAWGINHVGQLGIGTTSNTFANVAVRVPGLPTVVAIGATGNESYALGTDGLVYAWGQGDLGDGALATTLRPVPLATIRDVASLYAGGSIMGAKFAVLRSGAVYGWGGSNYWGGLGDGTNVSRSVPTSIPGMPRPATIAPSGSFSIVVLPGGGAMGSGFNTSGQLGDGTFANRFRHSAVAGEGGKGVLDLSPADPPGLPNDRLPVFNLNSVGDATDAYPTVEGELRVRSQDVGTTASTYVFALAPANLVKSAADGSGPFAVGKAVGTAGEKADVACVLAQLNSAGQLQSVSASSIQAYVTGVLSAQGQAVTVINGVPTANIGGATFYVGYGTSASAMLNNGLNRSVVSVPGSRECKPQAPQTGWWWNSAEGGRGYSIETQGANLFMASYLYDTSGRATWHVAAGPTSLDGSVFSGALMSFGSGVTLQGPFRANARLPDAGSITLAFDDATHGTLVWPGGTVALTRYGFGASGPDTPALAGQPESGWWWGGTADNGRGFFIEWQGARAFIAGYMYDVQGNAIWYVGDSPVTATQSFTGTWLQFANGQTLTGTYRSPTLVNGNVAPVTIQFQGADTATLTLPYGTIPITRFRF